MHTRRKRRHDERGSTTIEMVIVFPVVMSILWLALQAAIGYYGRTAALAAAESGARASAVEHGTLADCYTAAEGVLAGVRDAVTSASVTCTRSAATVQATINADALAVGPWPAPHLQVTAELPVERIT